MSTVSETVRNDSEATSAQEIKDSLKQETKPAEKSDEALETDGISCCGSCSG